VSSLEGVKAGDELLLLARYGGRREKEQQPNVVTVHKVGRTLVHVLRVESKPELGTEAYRIEDGLKNDNYGHTRLTTRAAYEESKKRAALFASLKEHGVTMAGRAPKSTATLEALLQVLDDAEQ
jgi:hypothetical protein